MMAIWHVGDYVLVRLDDGDEFEGYIMAVDDMLAVEAEWGGRYTVREEQVTRITEPWES